MVLISSADISDQVQYLDEPATGRARTALARLRSGEFFHKIGFGTSSNSSQKRQQQICHFRLQSYWKRNFANLVYVSKLLTRQRL